MNVKPMPKDWTSTHVRERLSYLFHNFWRNDNDAMAADLKVSKNHANRLVSGKANISMREIAAISDRTRCGYEWLVHGSGEPMLNKRPDATDDDKLAVVSGTALVGSRQERLLYLLKERWGEDIRIMACACHVPESDLRKALFGEIEPDDDMLQSVVEHEPKISLDWLLTGQGVPMQAVQAGREIAALDLSSMTVPSSVPVVEKRPDALADIVRAVTAYDQMRLSDNERFIEFMKLTVKHGEEFETNINRIANFVVGLRDSQAKRFTSLETRIAESAAASEKSAAEIVAAHTARSAAAEARIDDIADLVVVIGEHVEELRLRSFTPAASPLPQTPETLATLIADSIECDARLLASRTPAEPALITPEFNPAPHDSSIPAGTILSTRMWLDVYDGPHRQILVDNHVRSLGRRLNHVLSLDASEAEQAMAKKGYYRVEHLRFYVDWLKDQGPSGGTQDAWAAHWAEKHQRTAECIPS